MEEEVCNIYNQVLCEELQEKIISFFNSVKDDLPCTGNGIFPDRRQLRMLPDELSDEIIREVERTCSNYFTVFAPNRSNIRIYHSTYGQVKPHKDVGIADDRNDEAPFQTLQRSVETHLMINGETYTYEDSHTILIYLSQFEGGELTIKVPRAEGKNFYVTPEPRAGHAVIFPKNCIHYTEELYGDKVLVILDATIA